MLERFEGMAGYVNGERIDSRHRLSVVNPATELVIGETGSATAEQVEAAIAGARRSFDDGIWTKRLPAERVEVVGRMLDWFAANAETIRAIISAEAGCPIGSPVMAAQFDAPLKMTRDFMAYYLRLPEFEQNPVPLTERIAASGAFVESTKCHVPVGVVAAISAYNFPFFLNLWKVVPALITGNSMILRPSPLTPCSALIFAEAAAAAGLPAGVLNILVDAGIEGGVTLTSDDRIDMVTFTGSSHVGEQVAAQAARGIKRVQLELGGKSAQIFLPDRLEMARFAALSVCLAHAGQGCVLGTRILVPNESKAEILGQLVASLDGLAIGDPSDPRTQVGPVISDAQRARCERYVAAAVEAGARVVKGGKRPPGLDKGYYFEPTILDVPDNRNPAAQDEIFGPVVSVIGYDSIDHAVAMANDSVFGLSGYVFGKDMRQALAVAQRLRTGTVNVNASAMSAYASSGGFGASGIGRERGIEGIRAYQQVQVLNIAN